MKFRRKKKDRLKKKVAVNLVYLMNMTKRKIWRFRCKQLQTFQNKVVDIRLIRKNGIEF